MCNPRRVRITTTRQLDQAWQREITRTVSLRESVRGEARVRQQLGSTLGRPALRALESALAGNQSGWTETAEGYRHEVEGGYAIYNTDEQTLEIVAVSEDEVQAEGQETQRIEGRLSREISAEGEGQYYDDGYGGSNEESGRKAAQAHAERNLDLATQQYLDAAANEGEVRLSSTVEAAALNRAQEEIRQRADERQRGLEQEARRHLENVGLRARQAFHHLLADAYRDAILAYARSHNAEGIEYREDGEVVEIEFSLRQ
jgi:FtsH ternary system domain X2